MVRCCQQCISEGLVESLLCSLSDSLYWGYMPWRMTKSSYIYLVQTGTKPVHKIASPQMINILRERSHCFRQRERTWISFHKLGKVGCPFTKVRIKPLSQIVLLLNQSFVNTVSCQVNNGSLLIESLCNLMDFWTPFFLDSDDPRHEGSFFIFESGFHLHIICALFSWLLFCFVKNSNGSFRFNTPKIPGMSLSFSNDFVRNKVLRFVQRITMTECTINHNILGNKSRNNCFGVNRFIWILFSWGEVNLNEPKCTFLKDSLKILSENSSCITISPPEFIKSSLISASPGSSKVKAKRSRIIFLLMTFLQNES